MGYISISLDIPSISAITCRDAFNNILSLASIDNLADSFVQLSTKMAPIFSNWCRLNLSLSCTIEATLRRPPAQYVIIDFAPLAGATRSTKESIIPAFTYTQSARLLANCRINCLQIVTLVACGTRFSPLPGTLSAPPPQLVLLPPYTRRATPTFELATFLYAGSILTVATYTTIRFELCSDLIDSLDTCLFKALTLLIARTYRSMNICCMTDNFFDTSNACKHLSLIIFIFGAQLMYFHLTPIHSKLRLSHSRESKTPRNLDCMYLAIAYSKVERLKKSTRFEMK